MLNIKEIEFIRMHLVEKGVPSNLVTPSPFIWSKHINPLGKPFIFQSKGKVALFSFKCAVLYGSVSWLVKRDFSQELLVSAIAFAVIMGLIIWLKIVRLRKKLQIGSWKDWCVDNYNLAP
ncbi:hypothetical protein CGJ40_13030 [Vibrio parahaemolyticus]|uniref:DUF6404 family protein n=1 Tax=Vibrio parahaemolyticus TaxID=670 RepID=UPI000A3B1F81|nr:hypothetical protein CGJ40_13030 [Vibrio parahaemolyticus]